MPESFLMILRYLNLFNIVDVNQTGEVVFYSTISGASEGSDTGIFAGDGSSTRTIARFGDPVPSGDRIGNIFEESIRLNDLGQVFFAAVLKFSDPLEPTDTVGLFFHDPKLGLIEVARERESVGNPGIVTQLMPNLRTRANDASRGTLNASGQVVYRAFIGGNAVVLRWTPPVDGNPVPVPTPAIASMGDEIILRWPQTDSNLVLELTNDLRNSPIWRRRSEIIPVLTGTAFEALVPPGEGREFFRLRRVN